MNMMQVESLERLKNAVAEYAESLKKNIRILNSAAEGCEQAMGGDDISEKYIEQLDKAIDELRKTHGIAEQVVYALEEDKKRAMSVFD